MLFSILKRIAYLVWDIIKHPIRFFETLVTGLKQGISDFIENIGTHLKEAFWTWLTDATPGKSIRLSIGSGLAGLFDLVVQVLNLGPADLRAIVDRVLGPAFMQMVDKGVEFAEKAFEPVIILVKKGRWPSGTTLRSSWAASFNPLSTASRTRCSLPSSRRGSCGSPGSSFPAAGS